VLRRCAPFPGITTGHHLQRTRSSGGSLAASWASHGCKCRLMLATTPFESNQIRPAGSDRTSCSQLGVLVLDGVPSHGASRNNITNSSKKWRPERDALAVATAAGQVAQTGQTGSIARTHQLCTPSVVGSGRGSVRHRDAKTKGTATHSRDATNKAGTGPKSERAHDQYVQTAERLREAPMPRPTTAQSLSVEEPTGFKAVVRSFKL